MQGLVEEAPVSLDVVPPFLCPPPSPVTTVEVPAGSGFCRWCARGAPVCGAHSERASRPLPRGVSHQWLRFVAALSKEVILPDYDTENEVSELHECAHSSGRAQRG
ncbi:hypothetical protein HPB49_016704 [Dermacentor silvarum]|uniref:Uncharacterized protein n=1 Tax=Dermacentor silvarum TaxID=543639 RepID=A0ACB8E0U0_DERSI|nr:hypothetical protein HPB49_016704 [Dermacentor silvarum]